MKDRVKNNLKHVFWIGVICLIVYIFTGCAAFKEGFDEGRASVDPVCGEDGDLNPVNWFRQCPEDGSAPYWFWQPVPEKDSLSNDTIIEDVIIPSYNDEKPILYEEGGDNG